MPRLSSIGSASTGSFGFALNSAYLIEFLAVAGGGGGGLGFWSGGGGAGGYVADSKVVDPTMTLTAVIGAGGTPTTNGQNSSFADATAIGGGYGAEYNTRPGNSGGSGGGASYANSGAGSGVSGQGYAGGGLGGYYVSSGGGGADGPGLVGTGVLTPDRGGNGGAGKQWLDGTYRAGGGGGMAGGGGNYGNAGGTGGIGGGGNGGNSDNGDAYGAHGSANTGGGGGGGKTNGGSGVIALRYIGGQRGTGGTVVSSGGYTYHYFYSSGVFRP